MPMPRKKIQRFQRARRPEQIEQRSEDILQAALKLLVEKGLENVSLNDIASQVGCAKSNLYRYFESREHIYLIILQREGIAWEKKITPALQRLAGKGTIDQVANVITKSFMESERYSLLICVINSVLEKNLSPKLVADFRLVFFQRRERFAKLIAAALPNSKIEQISPLTLPIFTTVSGVWPLSHPPQESISMLDTSEFSYLKVIFEKEMNCFIQTLLRGALAGGGAD